MPSKLSSMHIGQGLASPYSGLAEEVHPSLHGSDLFSERLGDTLKHEKLTDLEKAMQKQHASTEKQPAGEPETTDAAGNNTTKESDVIDTILDKISSFRNDAKFKIASHEVDGNTFFLGGLMMAAVAMSTFLGYSTGKYLKKKMGQ